MLQRVCEAVAYAHSRGVLHRDLKPTNIMVGSFGETYVMDWGLARVLAEPSDDAQQSGAPPAAPPPTSAVQTRAGDVIGTPVYMAPEQALGHVDWVGAATDVYAIGAMLYHLLAGAMPYVAAGETPSGDAIIECLRQGPPPPIADLATRLPAKLIAICERAMARDPAARYPAMQALADDLRAFLEVRVVAAHGTGRLAVLRQWIRRNRGLATAITTTMLALAVGFTVSTWLFLKARANEQTALVSEQAAVASEQRAVANEKRADGELAASKFERARTQVRLGDMTFAENELWPQHIAGGTPRATHWALWETYANNRCLASIHRDATLGRRCIGVIGAGELVVMGGQDAWLRFLDGRTLRLVQEVRYASPIMSIDVSSDGTRIALGTTTGIELWDAARRRAPRRAHAVVSVHLAHRPRRGPAAAHRAIRPRAGVRPDQPLAGRGPPRWLHRPVRCRRASPRA